MTSIDRSELSRKALIEAASRLFVYKSYREVSTRELAEEAKVNQALIQYHFGSKGGLFTAAVDYLMEDTKNHPAFQLLREEPASSRDAAIRLSRFVLEFLDHLLRSGRPCAFGMMLREVASGLRNNAELYDLLVNSFVDKYGRPVTNEMSILLKKIKSSLTDDEAKYLVISVISQCSFYATHQPFIEAFDGVKLSDLGILQAAAKHIALFSLTFLEIEKKEFEEIFELARIGYNARIGVSESEG